MSTKITISAVNKLVAEYEGDYKDNFDRRNKLKDLVEKYGLELVATAAGFTEGTLHQYIRVKHVPSIRHDSVIQAERILKKAEQQ